MGEAYLHEKKNNLKVRNWKLYLCVLNNAAGDDKRPRAHIDT